MELLAWIVILGIAVWVWQSGYTSGKREGSRKAYGVGYSRGRRASNASGCLVAILMLFVIKLAAAGAIACSLQQ